mgnify:CR=1 FL=1
MKPLLHRLCVAKLFVILMMGCGVGSGTSTRLAVSDYDQSCRDVTQCILVDLDVCDPCQCSDGVIAEEAYDSFNEDRFHLKETVCPEDKDPESCPNCNLREPECRDESCLIK